MAVNVLQQKPEKELTNDVVWLLLLRDYCVSFEV